MKWDTTHTDSQVPFLASLSSQIFLCIGILFFEEGKSIWYKATFGFLSAFFLDFLLIPVFNKLNFIHINATKETGLMKNHKRLYFPRKIRQFLRLIFGAISTSLSFIFFLYSKGNNCLSNAMVFILSKLFIAIISGNLRTSKIGKVISCSLIGVSLCIIALSSNFKIIFLILSLGLLWLSGSYVKLLIPAFSNEPSVIPPLLLVSCLFSFIGCLFFEGFKFDFKFWKIIIGGCLVWLSPNFFVLMRKNINENIVILSLSIFPFLFLIFLQCIFLKDNIMPLCLYFSIILTFIGLKLTTFSVPEINVLRPFYTTKSTFSTIISILLLICSFYQYILSKQTNQLWRFTDSLYFIVNEIWSMSEVFYVMKRSSTEQFTFGYGRFSSIFYFSISIFAIFSEICVLKEFFLRDSLIQISYSYSIPSILLHISLLSFYIFIPKVISKKGRAHSIHNAVNINYSYNTDSQNKYVISFEDSITLILTIFGTIFQNSFFDSIAFFIYLLLITIQIIPVLKETIRRLMQSTPTHIESCYKQIKNEIAQCNCVTEISYLNFWQNDEALTAATVRVKINEKLCRKPQEFLMFIISICQQVGILDVTAEIVTKHEEVFFATSHNPFRRNSTLV